MSVLLRTVALAAMCGGQLAAGEGPALTGSRIHIACEPRAPFPVVLAAREIQRYIYRRGGRCP